MRYKTWTFETIEGTKTIEATVVEAAEYAMEHKDEIKTITTPAGATWEGEEFLKVVELVLESR
jgi:hypothetical protein